MHGWTADEIGDLKGRRAVVTGANSGLGYQTALQLAAHGAAVVLACRSPERGADALVRMRTTLPGADLTLAGLDLADLGSVRAFAGELTSADRPLDLLVNNAGVMAVPHARTVEGFEMQFGTNHLGHFALTGLLMPALMGAKAPRVVTVSSVAHVIGRINFADLQHERRYSKWLAYGQAKLANLLFTFELDRRAKAAHASLVAAAAHPGYAATNLQTAGPILAGQPTQARVYDLLNRIMAQPDADGALPSLYAATAPGVTGGEFIGPHVLMRGHPTRAWTMPAARNRHTARRLWEVSEELTGVRFDALSVA